MAAQSRGLLLLAFLSCALLARISNVSASPNGAPDSACESMIPAGHGTAAQVTESPYAVNVEKTSLAPGESLQVTLAVKPPDDLSFKGFLVRSQDSSGNWAGTFTVPSTGNMKALGCSANEVTAVTHTDRDEKKEVIMTWNAPAIEGEYTILVTFVQDLSTFWVKVPSPTITVAAAGGTTETDVTDLSSTSATNPASTEPAPTSTTPRDETVTEIYQGCETTKGCFGFPLDCIQTQDCTVVATYAKKENGFEMELQGKHSNTNGAYTAVGLSLDEGMGDDHVIACWINSTFQLEVMEYYNFGNRNNTRITSADVMVPTSLTLMPSYMKCIFELPSQYTVSELSTTYDLENDSYYILLASGRGASEEKLAYHDSREGSNTKLNFSEIVAPVPVTTTTSAPGEEVLEIYEGCASTKGCFGFPNDCIASQDCTVISTYVKNEEKIVFELSGRANGDTPYIAIGLSDDSSMGEEYVAACRVDGGNVVVDEFFNRGKVNLDRESDDVAIQGIKGAVVSGFILCSFSLPLSFNVTEIDTTYELETIPYYLLLAIGTGSSENGLQRHTDKQASAVKIMLPSTEAPTPAPTLPPGEEVQEIYEGCASTKGCFGFPNDCIASQDCTVISTYVKNEEKIVFELSGRANGDTAYIAIGLSDDSSMGEDFVVACRKDGDNVVVDDFYNSGKSNLDRESNDTEIQTISAAILSGFIQCSFSLPQTFDVTEIDTVYELDTESYYLLLAIGTGSSQTGLQRHTDKQASGEKVLLSSTEIAQAKSLKLIKVHGALMVFAWLFCASTGMFIGRYSKHTLTQYMPFGQALWFLIHRICMSLTFLLTVIAFIVIFVEIKGFTKGTEYASKAHPILGIIVTALALLQVGAALLRPHPGEKKRVYFNWFHWTVGNTSYIIAVACIYLASSLSKTNLSKDDNFWVTLTSFVVFHVFMHIVITLHTYMIDTKSQSSFGKQNRSLVPGPLKTLKIEEDLPGSKVRLALIAIYFIGGLVTASLLTYYIVDALK